jgi:transglutaminase-like putative cysteine protease
MAYARPSFPPGTPVLAGALDLIQRIFTDFTYDKSATTVDTTVDQVLIHRKGVCQDFAHVAISCLRSWGWRPAT